MSNFIKNFSLSKYKQLIISYLKHQTHFWNQLTENSKLHGQLSLPSDKLYEAVHSDSTPIFVLSTGRTGTKLLSEILELDPSNYIAHQPSPEFTYYSQYAYRYWNESPDAISMIVDAGRYEVIRDCYLLDKRYIETNNRITFFAYGLAQRYPKAKFVHLERDVLKFVTSGYSRNWYTYEKLFDEGRITPEAVGNVPWNDYSQVQKITWLWLETNQWIRTFTNSIDANRSFYLKSEDLYQSTSLTKEVLDFIGENDISEDQIRRKLNRPINAQPSRRRRILDESQKKEIRKLVDNYHSK